MESVHSANELWLHVADGTRELLLSHANVRTIIRSPVIHPAVPSQTSITGLVAYRNEFYSSFSLAELLGDPPCGTDTAAWGLLLDAPGVRLVLLVTNFFGLIKLGTGQSNFSEENGDAPRAFMGYVRRAERDLLMLDPLKLRVLRDLRRKSERQRWFDAKSIKPIAAVKVRKAHGARLVLFGNGGHIFAFPFKVVFNVRRIALSETPAPMLCERLGKVTASQNQPYGMIDTNVCAVDAGRGNGRLSGFACTIRAARREVDISFETLLESVEINDREVHTWIGMAALSLAGAFVHSQEMTVLLVDPELFTADGRAMDHRKPGRGKQDPIAGETMTSTGTMDKAERMVTLGTGKMRAALALSSIKFVSTVRSAHIHPMQMNAALVIGVLERGGMFASILDLGILLGSEEPTALAPSARLVEVGNSSGRIVILVAELGEPEEIQEKQIRPWNLVGVARDTFSAGRAFTHSDGRQIPILDVSKLLTAARGEYRG